MSTEQLPSKIALMKGGLGAGIMGGFALFSSFFAIDQMLDIPAGTFYKTIGVTMGVDGFCLLYTSPSPRDRG